MLLSAFIVDVILAAIVSVIIPCLCHLDPRPLLVVDFVLTVNVSVVMVLVSLF